LFSGKMPACNVHKLFFSLALINARNKRLQKELRILEEMSLEDVSKISQRSKKKSDEQKN